MSFSFENTYDWKAMTVMARTLRKTVRARHSRRSHLFGWIVLGLTLLLLIPRDGASFVLNFRTGITSAIGIILLLVLLFEDRINGYFARKRLLPGTEKCTVTFQEDGFTSSTDVGTTKFGYAHILLIAETPEYFVFIFSKSHAQIYEKATLSGGTLEEFRRFLQAHSGKEICHAA